MLRSIPFIRFPHLNVQGDINYPAWLVSGLIFADPAFPKAYGLPWGETIIGRGFDEFEEELDEEHFSIEVDAQSRDSLIAILRDLGSRNGTGIQLQLIEELDITAGVSYQLQDEDMILAGGRYLVFKINSLWRRTKELKV